MGRAYQICRRCIMDTSDPEITFDEHGYCNHCTEALERMKRYTMSSEQREAALQTLLARIKADGMNKKYDCLIGISGGLDSSMVLYTATKLGLRPLVVHFDNGWDSDLARENIRRLVEYLGVELHTYTVDWEEFRDLQLAFLKASVANCEAPTDHGITAYLFHTAHRNNIRYILSGSNLATESILPWSWGHYNQDLRHLKALHRRFGRVPLRTMPTISIPQYLYFVFVRGIRQIPFLNYIAYNRREAEQILSREVGWQPYGNKHYESVWTRFFQGYYLPTKFGIDKRRAHLSSLICAGQITREEALREIEGNPPYPPDLLEQDRKIVLEKLGLTEHEFDEIMLTPPKSALDYPNNYFLFHRLRWLKNLFRHIATSC